MSEHQWNDNHGADEIYVKFKVIQISTGKELGLDGEWIFPLRPERDRAAVEALETYANAVEYRAPTLAKEIRQRCNTIREKENIKKGIL